jgi:hypothetical protein
MTIAELFVNLGVKNEGSAQKALTGVHKTLGEISSTSLAAKAAIVGVIYGLERMMSYSAQMGMGLKQFTDFTGLSTDALQRWQYAARQSGVSAGEMTASIKGVQQAMGDMLLGKGAPEGMGLFPRTVGFDMKKAQDTFYVMEKLKESSRIAPPTIANPVLKSFGLGENTIAFLKTTKVELDKIKPSNLFSGGEISQLSKVEVAWSNFGRKLEMAMGHLTAKHGLTIVKELSNVTDQVLRLADTLALLSTRFKVFEVGANAIEGISNTLKLVNELSDKLAGKESKKGDLLYTAPGKETVPGFSDSPAMKFLRSVKDELFQDDFTKRFRGPGDAASDKVAKAPAPAKFPGRLPQWGKAPLPSAAFSPSVQKSAPAKTTVNNIKQDLNFQHDGKDAKQVGDSAAKAVRDAFRQMSAQGQGA